MRLPNADTSRCLLSTDSNRPASCFHAGAGLSVIYLAIYINESGPAKRSQMQKQVPRTSRIFLQGVGFDRGFVYTPIGVVKGRVNSCLGRFRCSDCFNMSCSAILGIGTGRCTFLLTNARSLLNGKRSLASSLSCFNAKPKSARPSNECFASDKYAIG